MSYVDSKNIIQILDSLPAEQKKEVYDFIEFISVRIKKHTKNRKDAIDRAYGLTKGSKLKADLFAKIKAEEIDMENKF